MITLDMIDNEIEEFEEDGKRVRNLKMLMTFKLLDFKYDDIKMKSTRPKKKKKLKAIIRTRNTNNNKSLF